MSRSYARTSDAEDYRRMSSDPLLGLDMQVRLAVEDQAVDAALEAEFAAYLAETKEGVRHEFIAGGLPELPA